VHIETQSAEAEEVLKEDPRVPPVPRALGQRAGYDYRFGDLSAPTFIVCGMIAVTPSSLMERLAR
jgi:hypothetical protein